jgi:hypothetical protein
MLSSAGSKNAALSRSASMPYLASGAGSFEGVRASTPFVRGVGAACGALSMVSKPALGDGVGPPEPSGGVAPDEGLVCHIGNRYGSTVAAGVGAGSADGAVVGATDTWTAGNLAVDLVRWSLSIARYPARTAATIQPAELSHLLWLERTTGATGDVRGAGLAILLLRHALRDPALRSPPCGSVGPPLAVAALPPVLIVARTSTGVPPPIS